MPLSKKKQAFVEFYLQCWNASEAARKAGYKGKSNVIGSRLKNEPEIAAMIDDRLNDLTMSSDEVLVLLTEIGRGSMGDFVTIEKGKPKLKFSPENMHLVKKLAIKPTEFGNVYEFELYDKMAALGLIGKHRKLFTDRVVVGDWRSQAIDDIRKGKLAYEALAEAFDDDLATELFWAAGVPITSQTG